MNRERAFWSAGCVVLLLFLGTSSARAQAPAAPGAQVVLKQDSLGATAFFSNVDETGCIRSAVFVVAAADSERETPSSSVRSAEVALVISVVDLCSVAPILTGNGVATDPIIVVAPNLSEAFVSAVVPVLNFATASLVYVSVDLTFVGTSPITVDSSHELNPFIPGYLINTTFHQNFRAATAFGSITTPTIDLAPEPSTDATIQDVIVGTVIIAQQ